jgi:hypothetical protein
MWWLWRKTHRHLLMVMAASMLVGAVVARRSAPLGVAMAIGASFCIVLFSLSQRRSEVLARATDAVDLAAIENLARTSPKKATASVVDSAKSVGRFTALRALIIVGGTRCFHGRPNPFAICSTDHEAIDDKEPCPMCAFDRELGVVVDAVGLMERGEYRAAGRLLCPKGAHMTPETPQEEIALPFRRLFGALAFTLAGLSELSSLKRIPKAVPTLRWTAQITMALVAHRRGEDVSALLREIPPHPEGTFIEALRASILRRDRVEPSQ